MDNFITGTPFTLILRILTSIASCAVFYYSVISLRRRWQLKISDFSDWVLVIVAGYWAVYTLYILAVFDGHAIPPLEFYIFNMRFGLLLTLSALIPLVKDRLLISELHEAIHKQQERKDDEESSYEPDI